jgi:hypothetical protein
MAIINISDRTKSVKRSILVKPAKDLADAEMLEKADAI